MPLQSTQLHDRAITAPYSPGNVSPGTMLGVMPGAMDDATDRRDRQVRGKVPVVMASFVRRPDNAFLVSAMKSITRQRITRQSLTRNRDIELIESIESIGPGDSGGSITGTIDFFDDASGNREIVCGDDGAPLPGEHHDVVQGWGGRAARVVQVARNGGMSEGLLAERNAEQLAGRMERGRILVEELMAMGLEASGGEGPGRGSSGMNGAWGCSTTADNSSALMAHGECCGECQCVTMNHGTTNPTVARSGGGS